MEPGRAHGCPVAVHFVVDGRCGTCNRESHTEPADAMGQRARHREECASLTRACADRFHQRDRDRNPPEHRSRALLRLARAHLVFRRTQLPASAERRWRHAVAGLGMARHEQRTTHLSRLGASPETPASRLSEVLGTSPVHESTQRDPLGYWVQIDTAGLRDRLTGAHHIQRPWTGPGLEMRRRLLPNGEYQYTLHSNAPITVPSTHVINVGRRGDARLLPPVRH